MCCHPSLISHCWAVWTARVSLVWCWALGKSCCWCASAEHQVSPSQLGGSSDNWGLPSWHSHHLTMTLQIRIPLIFTLAVSQTSDIGEQGHKLIKQPSSLDLHAIAMQYPHWPPHKTTLSTEVWQSWKGSWVGWCKTAVRSCCVFFRSFLICFLSSSQPLIFLFGSSTFASSSCSQVSMSSSFNGNSWHSASIL